MLAAMGSRSFVVTIAYIKTEPVQVALFGLIFLGDAVTPMMAAAIVIATAGVVVMSRKAGTSGGGLWPTALGLSAGGCFALSAIGIFYAYAFRWEEKVRSLFLIVAIIPITILANFARVITLVLIAYYGGPVLLEGVVHDLTGIGLFVLAVILLFLFDGFLGLCSTTLGRLQSLPTARNFCGV